MSDFLKTQNLHKIYNSDKPLHVLKGVNLEVKKGEVISIFGPSGAGKSTFLHLLGGLDRPTEGEVFFEGLSLYKISEGARSRIRNKRMGFVFQFYHLLPELTALENALLPALMDSDLRVSKPKIREKAYQLLKLVGLEARLGHFPSELSGGEQQRLAIVRALINDPEILLCDEPTGNLDSKTGGQICELLRRLNTEKKCTLIIVTHEEKIAKFADRIVYIKDGILSKEEVR